MCFFAVSPRALETINTALDKIEQQHETERLLAHLESKTVNSVIPVKRVLFVDDSLEFLELVRRAITPWSRDKWELLLTHDTAEAFTILATQKIDLIVCDLVMGAMDGIHFIKTLHRQYPQLRKVMLTGCEEALACKESLTAGADLYLIKPRSVSGFEAVFHSLHQLFSRQDPGFRGLIRKVSLADLIQLECMNGRSSVLDVAVHGFSAAIYIENGRIIHAVAGTAIGIAAFGRLMKIQGGDFELKEFSEPAQRTIDTSWEHLLLAAAQAADEEKGEPEHHPVTVPVAPVPADESAAHLEDLPVLPEADPPAMRRPRACEVLVLDSRQTCIFEWQCADEDGRTRLLGSLHEKCKAVSHTLAMGAPSLVEFQQAGGRAIAHFDEGRWTFCRTAYQEISTPHEQFAHA